MRRRGTALRQPVRKLSSPWLPNASSLDRVQALFSPEAAVRWAETLIAAGKPRPAFQHYVRAARSGLREAEYRIGRCYLEGVGVPLSRAEAVRWLERAGDHGHAEAQSLLAILYLQGMAYQGRPEVGTMAANSLFSANETTDPDWMKAERWARMAAESSSAEGQAVLAFLLTSGPLEMRNLDEADCWYERSAAAGCPQGMLGHALALARKGNGALQGEEAAYLRKAAEAGLPEALYLLGVINEHGLGVAGDKAAAAKFYRSAAEKGHRFGQVRFGLALINGVGVNASPFEGESRLRRAALGGDPEAAFLVGELYAKGGALPPNYVEAAKWFRRASEAGHNGAARALGQLHLTGAGGPPDPEEAARWFRISAAAGDSAARAELGNLVLKGIGGQDDKFQACQWFAQAAESGDLVAAFNYGVCLAQGLGVTQDDKQAAFWLRKAADDGVVKAQYWYGRVLIEGRGVDRDLPQGRSWIARAAECGMLDAQVALGEMMLKGAGGQRDPQGALALFEEAATKGHAGAMFALAAMYDAGHGVQTDRFTAQRWYRAAAESGHAIAQMMLGRYLARNLAGEYDPEQSRHWLKKALAQGQTDAAQDLAALSGAVALEVDLTEGPVKPYQEGLCACGSHLRSCRCCELDPKYLCTPEASEQAGLFVSRAAEALARGDAAEAETICVKVLDICPRFPSALWILYQVLRRGGNQRAAKTLLQRLVALEPNNVQATQDLAALLFEQGDLAAAAQHARNAIRLAPEDSRSHNLMGMILTETQRPQIGEFHYRRVLEISGLRDPILLANLAWNLKGQGKIAEARQLYEESIEAAPNIFQTLFGWAQLEEADRNFVAARSLLNRAAELRPDDQGLQVARATLLTRESDHAAALAELEPRPAGENGAAAGALLGSIALAERGRILDRMERYDEAFACFDEAKRRVQEETGKRYLDHEAREIAERLRKFFVSGHMRLMPPAPVRKERAQPIFILGFPRSGTTLAEQALSSHPRISAGDELPFFNELCTAIPRLFSSPLAYPEALAELWMGDNRQGLETLRNAYMQQVEMRGIVKAGSAWFTDKMPLNEMHLGLISLVFPGSPLIQIQRHPLDVVLSVFSHHLTHGYFCANALETVASHYVLVMDLVQHYRTEMVLRYLPIRYEDMVEDMRGSVRRMLDFIGESLDERCVNFHENRRLPHTPSYTQVAEKLYGRSRFRYRHYLRHLEPVIPILQPVMDRLGYTIDKA